MPETQTSCGQPLSSFLSKPALMLATPVLYRKSLEKYRKKSISLREGSEHPCKWL